MRQLTSDKRNRQCFCFRGALDGKPCTFRIDTGSDVTLVSKRFVDPTSSPLSFEEFNLRYPTGEQVPVTFRTNMTVFLGKFCEILSAFICKMQDDCILGGDFFERVEFFDNFFEGIFGQQVRPESSERICARVTEPSRLPIKQDYQLPDFLLNIVKRDTEDLNEQGKGVFSAFLPEFRNVFSEKIVAGNCNVIHHKIELSNPRPIKQAPRQIPLHLKVEVDKIVEDMKEQGVIEKSQRGKTITVGDIQSP